MVVALFSALCIAVEPSSRPQPSGMTMHSCVHCSIRSGGANLVLLHVSVLSVFRWALAAAASVKAQRVQLQGSTTGTPASERSTDVRAYSTVHTKQSTSMMSAMATLTLILMALKEE